MFVCMCCVYMTSDLRSQNLSINSGKRSSVSSTEVRYVAIFFIYELEIVGHVTNPCISDSLMFSSIFMPFYSWNFRSVLILPDFQRLELKVPEVPRALKLFLRHFFSVLLKVTLKSMVYYSRCEYDIRDLNWKSKLSEIWIYSMKELLWSNGSREGLLMSSSKSIKD